MILTITQSAEGRQISQYLRIVSAEATSGVNLLKDSDTGFRNLANGRFETYERKLGMTWETTLAELYQRAEVMDVDAVVGVDIDYEVPGADNGILMITASGTVVTLIQVTATVLRPWSGTWASPAPS